MVEYLGFKYIAILVDIAIDNCPKPEDPNIPAYTDEIFSEILRLSQQITQIVMLIQSHFYLEVVWRSIKGMM